MATIACPNHRPQMSTVRPGVMDKAIYDAAKKAQIISLPVSFAPGELRAEIPGASDCLVTAGEPARIVLDAGRPVTDGIAQIEVRLLDAEGRPAAQDAEIRYQVLGDAEILGIENGRPDDLTPYSSHTRRTCGSRAIVYLRVNGSAALYAWGENGMQANTVLRA